MLVFSLTSVESEFATNGKSDPDLYPNDMDLGKSGHG